VLWRHSQLRGDSPARRHNDPGRRDGAPTSSSLDRPGRRTLGAAGLGGAERDDRVEGDRAIGGVGCPVRSVERHRPVLDPRLPAAAHDRRARGGRGARDLRRVDPGADPQPPGRSGHPRRQLGRVLCGDGRRRAARSPRHPRLHVVRVRRSAGRHDHGARTRIDQTRPVPGGVGARGGMRRRGARGCWVGARADQPVRLRSVAILGRRHDPGASAGDRVAGVAALGGRARTGPDRVQSAQRDGSRR
jgi:hypothetical protein